MEAFSDRINDRWKTYINRLNYKRNENHVFISDLELVQENFDRFESKLDNSLIKSNSSSKSTDYNKYLVKGKCHYIPNKILPSKLVDQIFRELINYDYDNPYAKWKTLTKKLEEMSQYLMYSNITFDKLDENFTKNKPDTINILIMGGGPNGMYIANYLHANLMFTNYNLLIVDNRIPDNKEGYRLPFTRNRIFGVDLSLMSSFFPKFPCIKDLIKHGGIEIKYLESILAILTYGFRIPMIFTKKISDESSLLEFNRKYKIDIVFDCTGGRFKNSFIKNPSQEYISHFYDQNTITVTDQYKIDTENNESILHWINHIKHRFYLSIEIYDKKGQLIEIAMNSNNILFAHDVALLSKLHNKCFKIKKNRSIDFIEIFHNMTDIRLSKHIQKILVDNVDHNIKFFIIEPKLYHKFLISSVIKQSSQKTLYIGSGDTIFSSHFAVGAGLNRLLKFIDSIVWDIQNVGLL